MQCQDDKVIYLLPNQTEKTIYFEKGKKPQSPSIYGLKDAVEISRVPCNGSITLDIVLEEQEYSDNCGECNRRVEYIVTEWNCTERHITKNGPFYDISDILSYINNNLDEIAAKVQ